LHPAPCLKILRLYDEVFPSTIAISARVGGSTLVNALYPLNLRRRLDLNGPRIALIRRNDGCRALTRSVQGTGAAARDFLRGWRVTAVSRGRYESEAESRTRKPMY
jgi:hypothetical protein